MNEEGRIDLKIVAVYLQYVTKGNVGYINS